MSIYKKLLAVQTELKAPKNQFNSFGKYNYRNCEDILEAVKPLCLKNNCVLILKDEIVFENSRFYIKAIAQFIDCEAENNNIIECEAFAREEESKKGYDQAQVTGAASSYARKYALNGLFCIDDTKDADYTSHKEEPKRTEEKPAKVSSENVKYIYTLISKTGFDKEKLFEAYKVQSMNDLTAAQATAVINGLKKIEKEQGGKNENN